MTNIFKSKLKGSLLVVAVVIVGIGLSAYFTWLLAPVETEKEEEAVAQPTVPKEMKAGEVGELQEDETLAEVNPEAAVSPVRPPDSPMPPVVFNTSGTIISIEEDGLLVEGSGSNFEDQKSRILNIKFARQTITTEKGQVDRYQGLEGLNCLSPGRGIRIESSQNIRGKTEFFATYINKI